MFFNWLRPTVYVRLTPSWLSVRDIDTNKTIGGAPLLAIESGGGKKLLAIGADVAAHIRESGVTVFNPFTHPRSLISDLSAAEAVLKGFMHKLLAGAPWYQRQPQVIMHPCYEPDGGFTQVEVRALIALGQSVGATVKLWRGRELSDDDVRSGVFPSDGKLVG
jgi:rod shape-determining protein MreB and related proteins